MPVSGFRFGVLGFRHWLILYRILGVSRGAMALNRHLRKNGIFRTGHTTIKLNRKLSQPSRRQTRAQKQAPKVPVLGPTGLAVCRVSKTGSRSLWLI